MIVDNVTRDELAKAFRINSEGQLERLHHSRRWEPVTQNSKAGRGYPVTAMPGKGGRQLYIHRIVWILYNGDILDNSLQVDHIDGDKCNNNIDNLRLVSNRVNNQNKSIHKTTGRVGYFWCKRENKWQTQIRLASKIVFLGYFEDEKQASLTYKIACDNIERYVNNKSFRSLVNMLLILESY